MRLIQNQKTQLTQYCSIAMLFKKIALWYSLLHDINVILCPNVMTVQTSKGKVPHIYKELIIRIIGFEYEKLLLLKSSQNRVASNISTTRKKQYKSDISYIPGVFWDKVKKYKNKYTVKKYFIRWWW